MTTVAYGDVYPVTVGGKVIAIMLMFAGIGILWTFVAALSSKLVAERLERSDDPEVSESKVAAANQTIVMSSDNDNTVDSKNADEKIHQEERWPRL